MFNAENLYQIIQNLTAKQKFLIAYSGGLDSTVLLHAMVQIRTIHPEIQLKAIHINHGLSSNSDEWESHCWQTCQRLNVECIAKRIVINLHDNQSLEAMARDERYKVFADLAEPDSTLLVAHTQNDQAETFLLQLFRGAGVKGLASMPIIKKFACSELIRPLLNFTRLELEKYAHHHKLCWIEDESNLNINFDRNYLRCQIMPLLQQRWPNLTKTIARTAKHCAEANVFLELAAEQDFEFVNEVNVNKNTLVISKLLLLESVRQTNVIRYWLRQLHFPLPSAVKLRQIKAEILYARPDANPIVKWKQVAIRRAGDYLYALENFSFNSSAWSCEWDLQPLKLPENLGFLKINSTIGSGISLAKITSNLTVQFRRGGERCHPVGRQGSHPLKKLFQEWQVPSWQRNCVPLIFLNDQLIAVVGYCIDANYIAKSDEQGVTFWICE